MEETKKPGAYSGYTDARKAANARYESETVERISLVLQKGRKAAIKAHADVQGESVNGFINRAITETIEREGGASSEYDGNQPFDSGPEGCGMVGEGHQ